MSLRRALYAGTFDPFTNGHLDIVQRGLRLFEEVTVLVAVSPTKKPLMNLDERVALLKELFANEPRVKVEGWEGLVVDYARQNGIHNIIRGLRPTGDFEIEFQMASMNKKLFDKIDTVFLMTGAEHYFVSSSLVREIFAHKGEIKDFVPDIVLKKLMSLKNK